MDWLWLSRFLAFQVTRLDSTELFFFWEYIKSLFYDIQVESEKNLIARVVVAAGDISGSPRIVGRVLRSL